MGRPGLQGYGCHFSCSAGWHWDSLVPIHRNVWLRRALDSRSDDDKANGAHQQDEPCVTQHSTHKQLIQAQRATLLQESLVRGPRHL